MANLAEAVATFVENDQAIRTSRSKRYNDWGDAVKRILEVLNRTKAQLAELKCRSLLFDTAHSVGINFGKSPSGFVIEKRNETSHGIEDGAELRFARMHTGYVCVLQFPFELLMHGEDSSVQSEVLIEKIAPEQLTTDRVEEIVVTFLASIRVPDDL